MQDLLALIPGNLTGLVSILGPVLIAVVGLIGKIVHDRAVKKSGEIEANAKAAKRKNEELVRGTQFRAKHDQLDDAAIAQRMRGRAARYRR